MALVYGFYHKQNLGDELFKKAFPKFFPLMDFCFENYLSKDLLKQHSTVIIGGGSFLNQPFTKKDDCVDLFEGKTIYYAGVGGETDIHPEHEKVLRMAKKIWIRTHHREKFLKYNPNVEVIEDLVHLLDIKEKNHPRKNILFIPNIYTIPHHKDPYWKHSIWHFFKNEIGQIIDQVEMKFFTMSCFKNSNDLCAAYELCSASVKRHAEIIGYTNQLEEIENIFNSAKCVITQRYHGIILAKMTNTPFIAICHDNKLKEAGAGGIYLDYAGCSKSRILESIEQIQK